MFHYEHNCWQRISIPRRDELKRGVHQRRLPALAACYVSHRASISTVLIVVYQARVRDLLLSIDFVNGALPSMAPYARTLTTIGIF